MSSDLINISTSDNNQTMASDRIIYIKMLSGDIITILLKRFYGLFMLKREIMNYLIDHTGQDVTTNEIILMDMEENKELIDYPNLKVKLKDKATYLLFVRDKIINEKISFIYAVRGIELYRFSYLSKKEYVAEYCFSVNGDLYSMGSNLSFSNHSDKCYNSFNEMITNNPLSELITEESIQNLIYIWERKYLIDRDNSHMEL